MDQSLIRNFAIIAHIDHGKSTLADRLLEMTGTVSKRDLVEQTLDSHPVSRERGITIRLSPVTMHYEYKNVNYELNLIDTPGHVDFSYEVEKSLAACEGAILLVDATQGIQAQTLSHLQKAQKLNLKIIPVINKIDMPNASVEETVKDLAGLLEISEDKIFRISAKTGQGVKELLENVIEKVPTPKGISQSAPRALIFSSQFDPQRGVIAFVRIVDGKISDRDRIYFLSNKTSAEALEIGRFAPAMTAAKTLETGEVGYIITNVKEPSLVKVGDTITILNSQFDNLEISPLPGYRDPKPVVFVSFFPVDQSEFALLEDALKKLHLNDAALTFAPTSSKALGRGYRCGFLGHLHAEVSRERLETDFNLSIIATMPTVEYRIKNIESGIRGNVYTTSPHDSKFMIHDSVYEEPWVKAIIITPADYVGAIITLCEDRRGKLLEMTLGPQRSEDRKNSNEVSSSYRTKMTFITYELPLAEIITDFFDQLKSKSSGYASLDYELIEYRPFDAVTLDIIINHEPVDAFSQIMEKSKAEKYGKNLVEKLAEIIPRQQIPIPIQASIDGQVIARSDIKAYRKDVTAKLYGGDFTRRLKLIEKQKKGKEKMRALSQSGGKMVGKVEIPNDTFLKVFQT